MSSPNLTHMTSTKKPRGKRMTEKKLNNFELYEIDGELYSLEEIKAFITNCDELAKKTCRQTRFIRALKLNNSALTLERNKLCDELNRIKSMGMFEFANKYCEEQDHINAGRQFAQELLGNATLSDLAEEKAIADGEAHYERTAFLGDDF